MKTKIFGIFIICLFAVTSCATLQEDTYVSTSTNAIIYDSIEEYEDQFIRIDNDIHTGKQIPSSQIKQLISSIDLYAESTFMEPALKARLYSFQGLLYVYSGKNSKALELYKTAKAAQSSDSYLLLLGTRLGKTLDEQLESVTNLLKIVPDDPIIILEKAKIQNKLKLYAQAVASINQAFIIIDKNKMTNYREVYGDLQNVIWQMYQLSNNQKDSNLNLKKALTPAEMIELTNTRTNLLSFFTGGTNIKSQDLLKKLSKINFVSEDMMKTKTITKSQCAIFIWKLYAENSGKTNQLDKYSKRYIKLQNVESPVKDVKISSPYFDAVLGLVENEIMDLPDGNHFYPDEEVTVLDFITWIDLCDKKINY